MPKFSENYFKAMERRLRIHLRFDIERTYVWPGTPPGGIRHRAASERTAMDSGLSIEIAEFLMKELPSFAKAQGYTKRASRKHKETVNAPGV